MRVDGVDMVKMTRPESRDSREEVLTLQEVAAWLKIKPRQVLRLGIPCLDLGHKTKRFLAEDVRAWLAVRGEVAAPELFVSHQRRAMTRAGFTYLLHKHAQRAAQDCPSLQEKPVTPHVLRHTCAMMIYQATGDLRIVSLWLGHADMQATEAYVRADPTEKLDALDAIIPPSLRRGKFTVPDRLIAMLHGQ